VISAFPWVMKDLFPHQHLPSQLKSVPNQIGKLCEKK
ncbi:unnamed protein product, partial [Caretta caretta]